MICDRARGDREPWLRGLSMHPRHAKAEQKCGAKLCERRHLAVLSSGLLLATKAASAAGDNHLCGEGPSAQTAIALSSLPACSGTMSQTPTAMATMKTGMVRKASAKEPVACCSATVANGHSTNPTKKPMNHTTPLATPRTRVGKTSAVNVVLGPQKPRKPKLQARPKTQSQRSLAA